MCTAPDERIHVPEDTIRKLGGFPTATIHEAMGQKGAVDWRIKPIDPSMKLCGRAITAVCRPDDNLPIHMAISIAKPGDVLVATANGYVGGAMWGEIVTVAAKMRGMAGTVIDGGVRDVEKVIQLGFPVFARGVSIRGTTKKTVEGLNTPIVCGGVSVEPGDIVIGDRDGVVVVPAAMAEETLRLAEAKEAAEDRIMERIRAGELTIDILNVRPSPTHPTE